MFVSGVYNVEWCFMFVLIVKDGELVLDDVGNLKFKFWMMYKSEYEIFDIWNVVGMCGLGSYIVWVDGVVVLVKYVGVDFFVFLVKYDNFVYRIFVLLCLLYNKVVMLLGVVKGVI